MKILLAIPLAFMPLLFACAPVQPVLPDTEVPAGPLIAALEHQRQSFQSLRALASVQASKRGRRITFDNVGILLKSDEKLRMEAYSPLGSPLVELVWDGIDVFVGQNGRPAERKAAAGLERILGAPMGPQDLCSLLAGNVPGTAGAEDSRALCGAQGCVLELRRGALLHRVWFSTAQAGNRPVRFEAYQSDILAYRVRFEGEFPGSPYPLPRRIIVERAGGAAGLIVEYEDAEVNIVLDDGAFVPSGPAGSGR